MHVFFKYRLLPLFIVLSWFNIHAQTQATIVFKVVSSGANIPVKDAEVKIAGSDGSHFSIFSDVNGTGKIKLQRHQYEFNVTARLYNDSRTQMIDSVNWMDRTFEIKLEKMTAYVDKDISVYFEKGSSLVTDKYKLALNAFDSVLKKYDNVKIEIGGHSRCSGNSKKDQELSLKRAAAVKAYLLGKGIEPNRLMMVGYGSKYASCPCDKKSNCDKTLLKFDDKAWFKILSIEE